MCSVYSKVQNKVDDLAALNYPVGYVCFGCKVAGLLTRYTIVLDTHLVHDLFSIADLLFELSFCLAWYRFVTHTKCCIVVDVGLLVIAADDVKSQTGEIIKTLASRSRIPDTHTASGVDWEYIMATCKIQRTYAGNSNCVTWIVP